MRRFPLFRGAAIALAFALAPAFPSAAQDTVTQWNEHMQATVVVAPSNPNLQTRWGAIVQLAVFEAVNAIEGDYEPYLGTIEAPPWASPDAAAIAAAHRTLVTLRPAAAAALHLDDARATALNAIPDGPEKEAGIDAGEAAAAAMLLLRADDGSAEAATKPYTPGTAPGEWQPTPLAFAPALLPGWGEVTPFGLESGSQYRLSAPPALHTGTYASDYNEVKLVGEKNSLFRPQDRTDVAMFYAVASPVQVWNLAARQVSAAQGKTLSENARTLALLAMGMADASIAGWDTKYHYNLWRPVTAIQNGDLDGNDGTDRDADWLPLINTPAHPSYASGHATVSGAARAVLEHAFGKDGHAVMLTNPGAPGIVLEYTAWDEITDDIDDARVYGGIHFRFDQDGGNHLGRHAGKYILKNYLRSEEELDDENDD